MSAPPHPDSETRPTAPARPRRSLDPVGWAVALLLAAGAALATLSDLIGLDAYSPFAQLIAFRPVLVGVLVVVVLVGLPITMSVRRYRPVPLALALVAVAGAAMIAPRTVPSPVPAGGHTLKVLSLNVYEGAADTESFAALVDQEKPDLVAIPEAGGHYKQKLETLLKPMGYRLSASVAPWQSDVSGNTIAVSERLGDVRTRAGDDTQFPSMEATGGGLGDLRFVAFHSVAPLPHAIGQWRSDLQTLPGWCASGGPVIVAGDFNASGDHSIFRTATAGCTDAGAQAGNGVTGTWPTWAPSWLGPQIDHVLSSGGITAETFETHLVAGSDHRAIVATLRLP